MTFSIVPPAPTLMAEGATALKDSPASAADGSTADFFPTLLAMLLSPLPPASSTASPLQHGKAAVVPAGCECPDQDEMPSAALASLLLTSLIPPGMPLLTDNPPALAPPAGTALDASLVPLVTTETAAGPLVEPEHGLTAAPGQASAEPALTRSLPAPLTPTMAAGPTSVLPASLAPSQPVQESTGGTEKAPSSPSVARTDPQGPTDGTPVEPMPGISEALARKAPASLTAVPPPAVSPSGMASPRDQVTSAARPPSVAPPTPAIAEATPVVDGSAMARATPRQEIALPAPVATSMDLPVAAMTLAPAGALTADPTEGVVATAVNDGPLTQAAMNEITTHVRLTSIPGRTSCHLKLMPDGLGELAVSINVLARGTSIHLTVATPEAHAAVERQLALLRGSLEASGVALDELTVTLRDSHSGSEATFDHGRQGLPQPHDAPDPQTALSSGIGNEPGTDATTPASTIASSGNGHIDYRV